MTFAKEIGQVLESIGLTTILIPFLLTFVIMFAVLQKTKILGKRKNNKPKVAMNAVVALVIGFFVIAFTDTVIVMNRIAQYGVVLLIAGLIAVIVFAFTGFPQIGKSKLMKTIGFIAFLVFAFYVLGAFELIDISKIQSNIIIPVIAIVTFIAVVYFIIKPTKAEIKPRKKTPERELPEEEEIPI